MQAIIMSSFPAFPVLDICQAVKKEIGASRIEIECPLKPLKSSEG